MLGTSCSADNNSITFSSDCLSHVSYWPLLKFFTKTNIFMSKELLNSLFYFLKGCITNRIYILILHVWNIWNLYIYILINIGYKTTYWRLFVSSSFFFLKVSIIIVLFTEKHLYCFPLSATLKITLQYLLFVCCDLVNNDWIPSLARTWSWVRVTTVGARFRLRKN